MEESHKRGRSVFAAVFLTCLFFFSALNLAFQGPGVLEELRESRPDVQRPKEAVTQIEEEMSEELFFRYPLIEGYGAIQLLMGKKEENAFSNMKGKDGMLYDGNFWNGFGDDQKKLAVRTRRLYDQLKEKGIKMGVIIYPMKIPDKSEKYYGLPYNDFSELAGDFASWLRYYKVPMLDLTDFCKLSGLSHREAFFRTDHHWTPRGAFEGYRLIVDWMNESLGASLDPDGRMRDLSRYIQETFPEYMLGSQGREAGRLFAGGAEDYTVIYPKETGDYLLKRGKIEDYETYTGTFKKALLKLEKKRDDFDDIYNGRAEGVYLHNGVDPYVSIQNLGIESKEKVLLLRDSYATPIGAFLAQSFERVDMLWTLEIEEKELADFLGENHYDYVLLSLFPQNLSEKAFPFGMEITR